LGYLVRVILLIQYGRYNNWLAVVRQTCFDVTSLARHAQIVSSFTRKLNKGRGSSQRPRLQVRRPEFESSRRLTQFLSGIVRKGRR